VSERKVKDAIFAQRDAPRKARVSWIPSSIAGRHPVSSSRGAILREPPPESAPVSSNVRPVEHVAPPAQHITEPPATQTSPQPPIPEPSSVMLSPAPVPASTPGFFEAMPEAPRPAEIVAPSPSADAAIEAFLQAAEALSEIRALRATRVERDLVQLAGAIAERVCGRELQMDPTLLATLARDGMMALADRESVTVRFSTDTPDAAKERLLSAVESRAPGCKVVFDRELVAGSCVVESAQGFVDESVTTRLDIVMEQLGFGGGGLK
jgi:hypothetical protein